MIRTMRLIGTGVLAMFVSACSPPQIDVRVVRTNGGVALNLSQDWGVIFSDRKPPCVSLVALDRPSRDLHDPLWKIVTKIDGQCIDLASVRVGETPRGFVETVPLSEAAKGRLMVVVMGTGAGQADVTF